jgi:hypothetical protein
MDDIELLKKMYADLALDYGRFRRIYEDSCDARAELLDNIRTVIYTIFSPESKSRISKEDRKVLAPIAKKVGLDLD